MFFPANTFFLRNLSALVLVAVLANIIIGGVLLPYRAAQAVIWSTFIQQLLDSVVDIIEWVISHINEILDTAYAAINAAFDYWQQYRTYLLEAIKYAWNVLRKKLLDMLIDDIVKWIQGGGSPKLVTDWKGYLTDAANQAGGQFVDQYLGMGFLCKRFDMRIRIALASVQTFDQRAKCTISDIVGNVDDFFDNFNNGGWEAWLSITEPSNNIFGAYLLAMDETIGVASEAQKAAQNEAIASAGFLGDKVCRAIFCPEQSEAGTQTGTWKQTEIPEGCNCTQWEVRTPGKVAADAISKSATMDIDYLISADEYQEYLSAIINAVINRITKEGLTTMTTGTGSAGQHGPGIDEDPDVKVDLGVYRDSIMNKDIAAMLVDQIKFLQENEQKLLTTYQKTLVVLSQIKTEQIGALNTLADILAIPACSLPGGVTVNITSSIVTSIGCTVSPNCTPPCTVQTLNVTAANFGQMIVIRQIAPAYVCTALPGGGQNCICSPTQQVATTQIASSTAAIEPDIAKVSQRILELQADIAAATTAIADLGAYVTVATSYIDAYESGDMEIAVSLEPAVKAAKQKALDSTKLALRSTAKTFQEMLTQIQGITSAIAQEYGAVQLKLGAPETGCENAIDNTYHKQLCDVQETKSDWQAKLTACRAAAGT